MKFLNEFSKMKSDFKSLEKANEVRKQEHNRRFEKLKNENESQSSRVSQQLKIFHPRNK